MRADGCMGDLGKAMIPSKWSGAGTWFDLKGNMKTINMCNQSQHFFWRVMLTVPGGMSKHCSEVRDGYVGNEVERKIMLLVRIKICTCQAGIRGEQG